MSRLYRGIHNRISQQANGAPKGWPDNQDRVGGNVVEEQSGGSGWQLGEDPFLGMFALEIALI